jgi:hypothetical protein
LTPNHDTFDLADALAEPIGMMKGLQYGSGGEVTLLPLSPTICKQVRRPACHVRHVRCMTSTEHATSPPKPFSTPSCRW